MQAATADGITHKSAKIQFGAYVMLLGALCAFLITLWRYITPLSGVNGSGGAELTMVGEAALILASVILLKVNPGVVRKIFLFLSCLGVVLTFIASLFLHGWFTAFFLAVCALGVVIELFYSRQQKRG
ncbi:hypothetical protein ACLBWZ_08510 [Brucellaceae bacterium C25G]